MTASDIIFLVGAAAMISAMSAWSPNITFVFGGVACFVAIGLTLYKRKR